MTKRIFRTILLVAAGVFAASALLFLSVLYDYFSALQQNQLRIQTDLAARGVETGGLEYLNGLEAEQYRVTWIDAGGGVLYDSRSSAGEMENHLAREEVREALEQGQGASVRASATAGPSNPEGAPAAHSRFNLCSVSTSDSLLFLLIPARLPNP